MNTENIYCVYAHVNKINGKIYIGQTLNYISRWSSNGRHYQTHNKYNNKNHFYNSIKKYGWTNFEHIILEKELNKEQADKIEKNLINTFNTTNQRYGYNVQDGGSKGKLTKEAKKYIYEQTKKAMKQPDIRNKYLLSIKNRASMKGENNPFYGKKHTKETRDKMKLAWVKRKLQNQTSII